MAEQSGPDVVNQSLSVGDDSPSGAPGDNSTSFTSPRDDVTEKEKSDSAEGEKIQQNANTHQATTDYHQSQETLVCSILLISCKSSNCEQHNSTSDQSQPTMANAEFEKEKGQDGNLTEQGVEKATAGLESETTKSEQVATEDGKQDPAAARKVASFKPVTFAKYSAPKAAGLNVTAKPGTEKSE